MKRQRPAMRGNRFTLSTLAAALLTALAFAAVAPARADESSQQLVVLQSDRGVAASPLTREVDRRVLEAVAQRGFTRAYVSPVPFEDVELAAGCSGQDAGCLQRIAATLDADWIMVRELARDASGRIYLTLVAHDGPSALVTRRAIAELGKGGPHTPPKVVPMLVERLYPGRLAPEPLPAAAPSAPAREAPLRASPSPARVVGWSAAAAGTALLAAGVVVGALSRNDQQTHSKLPADDFGSADRLNDLFARAQRRTHIANGLMFSGGGLAAAGVATLLWDYLRPHRDQRLSVNVMPARSGAALTLRTSFRGGL